MVVHRGFAGAYRVVDGVEQLRLDSFYRDRAVCQVVRRRFFCRLMPGNLDLASVDEPAGIGAFYTPLSGDLSFSLLDHDLSDTYHRRYLAESRRTNDQDSRNYDYRICATQADQQGFCRDRIPTKTGGHIPHDLSMRTYHTHQAESAPSTPNSQNQRR